jgi:hypothetical protein
MRRVCARRGVNASEERKRPLFWKKAAQKTFVNWARAVSPPQAQHNKSFLLLFWKKKRFLRLRLK